MRLKIAVSAVRFRPSAPYREPRFYQGSRFYFDGASRRTLLGERPTCGTSTAPEGRVFHFLTRQEGQSLDANHYSMVLRTYRYLKLRQRILWTAESFGRVEEFEQRAALVASELEDIDLDLVPRVLRARPGRVFRARFPGLTGWIDAWFATVFQVLYRARGRGLPTLLQISRGPYDWVQGLAVDKLAWLASEGVQTEFVAQEFVAMLAQWRYETVLRAMPGLAALAGRSPQFGETLLQLADEWAREDPVEALEILGPLSEQAPTLAKERQSLLRQIMTEHGQGLPRGPLADGQVVVEGNQLVAVGGRQYPPINHLHAIRAALTLRSLDPRDAEMAACLEQWMEHHPDPSLRSELKQRLTD